jgi:dihydrolipoamide dehydrogenase
MAIIGSGAIGSEMAYFYTSMGTKVTLIEYMEQIVPTEDEEVAAQLSRSFRKLGMKVMPGANVVSAEKHSDRVMLNVQTRKGAEAVKPRWSCLPRVLFPTPTIWDWKKRALKWTVAIFL